MSVSPVYSSTQTSTADGSTRVAQKSLTQSDFLKLLVAQLTAQNPLNPQSNTDFAAQMAQFSSLQATQDIQSNLTEMNSQQQFATASSLLGQTVQVENSDSTAAQGVVTAIQMNSGTPQLVINGQYYTLSQVTSVTPASSSQ
jgi:flagellar basal-body rod modification protein FlgD